MIYEEPRFLPGGDRFVLIEFGNEMNLELNFMAQGLAEAIETSGTKGVVETAPCFASLLVHYDSEQISLADLTEELKILISNLGPSDDLELVSRLFYFPAVYRDPWTRDCVADYRAKITEKEPDPEFVARINGLEGPEQLVRVHSASEYWVAALGFWPGLPFMMPLDPRSLITAPKYNPPRTWTPQGTIGMGGAATAIYPVATPGGYQIFARTPVPIWDPDSSYSAFGGSICLFRAGDRVKFVPITVEEFEFYEAQVKEGRYVFNVNDYQKFSVRGYKQWLESIDAKTRF